MAQQARTLPLHVAIFPNSDYVGVNGHSEKWTGRFRNKRVIQANRPMILSIDTEEQLPAVTLLQVWCEHDFLTKKLQPHAFAFQGKGPMAVFTLSCEQTLWREPHLDASSVTYHNGDKVSAVVTGYNIKDLLHLRFTEISSMSKPGCKNTNGWKLFVAIRDPTTHEVLAQGGLRISVVKVVRALHRRPPPSDLSTSSPTDEDEDSETNEDPNWQIEEAVQVPALTTIEQEQAQPSSSNNEGAVNIDSYTIEDLQKMSVIQLHNMKMTRLEEIVILSNIISNKLAYESME